MKTMIIWVYYSPKDEKISSSGKLFDAFVLRILQNEENLVLNFFIKVNECQLHAWVADWNTLVGIIGKEKGVVSIC